MLNTILANWTAQFSQHINNQFHANAVTERVTMVTEVKPTGTRDPEVIEVDPPEPGTPGNVTRAPHAQEHMRYAPVMREARDLVVLKIFSVPASNTRKYAN